MNVTICDSPADLGRHAGDAIGEVLLALQKRKEVVRMGIASAPSQTPTLERLLEIPDIAWSRIEVFHQDQYVGLPADHPASFSRYAREHLVDNVILRAFHPIDGMNAEQSLRRLNLELKPGKLDLCLIGIGENAHVAFNDPPCRMDTGDDAYIMVELDEACRNQQFAEGHFPTLEAVPKLAISMSMRMILSCEFLIGSVFGPRKTDAVYKTMNARNDVMVPASFLHDTSCRMFFDRAAAARL